MPQLQDDQDVPPLYRNILSCLHYLFLSEVFFAMNQCIWYFGLVLHNNISCVKHMDFCFKFYDENRNMKCIFLLLKCINHFGKINYYLSHSNLESKIYLVISEFVQVNFKLKKGLIERSTEREGSVLIILIRSVISYKLFIIIYNVDTKHK